MLKRIEKGRMKHQNMSERRLKILEYFTELPSKMLTYNDVDNMVEFVLHCLCSENCFNVPKAAYLIDNVDFDCLKGMAGYHHAQKFNDPAIWAKPDHFTSHMKQCDFNQQVRSISRPSALKSQQSKELAKELGELLAMNNPALYSWKIKYDNYGIFIFEPIPDADELNGFIFKGLHLLGFCPMY